MAYGVFRREPSRKFFGANPRQSYIPTKQAPTWTPVASTRAYAVVLSFGDAPGTNYAETTLVSFPSITADDVIDAWLIGPQPGASYDPKGTEFPMRGGFVFPKIRITTKITPSSGFVVVGSSDQRITGDWGISIACNKNVFA